MSQKHIDELHKALRAQHWKVDQEVEGNDYDISGYWEISRYGGKEKEKIVFEGLDDMETLPIEQSYACHIDDKKTISVYFSSSKEKWKNDLEEFVNSFSGQNNG